MLWHSVSRDSEIFRVWPEDNVSVSIQLRCKPHNSCYHQVIQFKHLHIPSFKDKTDAFGANYNYYTISNFFFLPPSRDRQTYSFCLASTQAQVLGVVKCRV